MLTPVVGIIEVDLRISTGRLLFFEPLNFQLEPVDVLEEFVGI
jgi:hypothetical protein